MAQLQEHGGTSSDSSKKIVALGDVAAKEDCCTKTSTKTRRAGGLKTTPFIIGKLL
jgi:hypothetical protein